MPKDKTELATMIFSSGEDDTDDVQSPSILKDIKRQLKSPLKQE